MLNVWEVTKGAKIPKELLPYVSEDSKWLSRTVDLLEEIKSSRLRSNIETGMFRDSEF